MPDAPLNGPYSMSPEVMYHLLPPAIRQEIAAPCFVVGRFDADGDIDCWGVATGAHLTHRDCQVEWLCDLMAIYMLVPKAHLRPSAPTAQEARRFDVEPWVIDAARMIYAWD